MSKAHLNFVLIALAFGALPACGADAAAPGPQSPASTPAAGQAAATQDPAAAGDPSTDAKPAADDAQAASSGASNAKESDAAPKAGNGSIVGHVDVNPAKMGKDVVVYLTDAPPPEGKQVVVTVDQRKMAFSPFVTAVPVGSKIVFRNSDPFPHNIFSPDHERFDLGTIAQNGARVRVFKTPGPYTLLCNVHPGMLAYIDVVPTPYFTMADKDGKFEIKNVPPGKWTVEAWGPKLAPASQPVTVSGGQATVNLSLHRGG